MEAYKIKIDAFEGPFDLLFHLIEKNKIDIYDIPVSLIADQYMDHIFAMQEMDLDVASEFLVMASTLLHIKSRLMLPTPAPAEGEGEDGADPREALVVSMIEYGKYKSLAAELKSNERYWGLAYFRDGAGSVGGAAPAAGEAPEWGGAALGGSGVEWGGAAGEALGGAGREGAAGGSGDAGDGGDAGAAWGAQGAAGMAGMAGVQLSFLPDDGGQPFDRDRLAAAYRQMLEKNRRKMSNAGMRVGRIIERDRIPLAFKIREVLQLLKSKPRFLFQKVFDMGKRSRLDVVTAFSAVLELTKQERVRLRQDRLFGDLTVMRKKAGGAGKAAEAGAGKTEDGGLASGNVGLAKDGGNIEGEGGIA